MGWISSVLVCAHTHKHTDEPILSFQRDAFFLLKEERKLLDPKTDNRKAIDLLFNEVS